MYWTFLLGKKRALLGHLVVQVGPIYMMVQLQTKYTLNANAALVLK